MAKLDDHPAVRRYRERMEETQPVPAPSLVDSDWLKSLCLNAGADDVGFVGIDRSELSDQRDDILRFFPQTRTLISFVCRMNREPIRRPDRSVANVEFHQRGEDVNEVAHRIVAAMEALGIRAVNPAMGFPMEMGRFPGKIWIVSHKPVAVAAGLGHMGLHRNVIHPRFGNFILLGTVLLDAEVSAHMKPIDYNPCLECKLCVAACPVGAIDSDGTFSFSACYTHNYREFMGGFTDWVENIAASGSAKGYRRRVSDSESASMWQSLSFGANYKAAYCMAVCPAGDDVIGPFLTDRKAFLQDVVRPLQDKMETVYVVSGSDAEAYVTRRFPHKHIKRTPSALRPVSIDGFLQGMVHVFQPKQAEGLKAIYHFSFVGAEPAEATITIADQSMIVQRGLLGCADLKITADSRTWLRFVRKEEPILWALIRRRIRLKGPIRLLIAFGKCFPG